MAADFRLERTGPQPVCGIDEAGRGPLAGPVVAAAVILDPATVPQGLADSKTLSGPRRETLAAQISAVGSVGVGIAEPEEIDRLNILQATLAAMTRAVTALPVQPARALVDGNRAPSLPCAVQTVIKGDAKSASIAAASIIAKTLRDALMAEADARWPGYGFAKHKGYPTAEHSTAVAQLGLCPIHRRRFRIPAAPSGSADISVGAGRR
ncbi:MAG: ribonuclease HII [Maricaulaceae bacterium]